MKTYKERRLYYFTCEQCGKVNRHSFKRKKAKGKICKKCRGQYINPNQQSLFGIPVIIDKNLPLISIISKKK
jgi:NAD-dependent SIR2 family protein deacetylase